MERESNPNWIKAALVAPGPAVRAGIHALLSASDQIEICQEANSLSDLKKQSLIHNRPDQQADVLILVEWGSSPSDLLNWLQEKTETPAVLLLLENQPVSLANQNWVKVLKQLPAAWGLLSLEAGSQEMIAALGALANGLWVASADLAAIQWPRSAAPDDNDDETVDPLTARETDVLEQMAQGLTNKQIAYRLGISEHTVKYHISSIYSKLNAANRTEAVRIGARKGWISL